MREVTGCDKTHLECDRESCSAARPQPERARRVRKGEGKKKEMPVGRRGTFRFELRVGENHHDVNNDLSVARGELEARPSVLLCRRVRDQTVGVLTVAPGSR